MADRSHESTNDASRRRLETLVTSLSTADFDLDTGEGWTVAMVLGHVAFWDRWQLARWHAAGDGAPADVPSFVTGIVNEANEAILRAIPTGEAGRLVLATAAELDAFIATLPDGRLDEVRVAGSARLIDRAHHRLDHVAQIERALGGTRPG